MKVVSPRIPQDARSTRTSDSREAGPLRPVCRRRQCLLPGLGILVPKYKKNSDVSNNYWTPHENYTLLYNVMFKTTKSDVKIIDYNRDYVALPPGQVGWDDKLLKLSPEFYYYYVILSSSKKKVPIDKYIPLVYLNTLESDDFKLTKISQSHK